MARNTLWNLIGGIAPFALAVFAIPILVHRLGVYRYGVIALAWLVVGYFGLFDFGLGRTVTKFVADAVGAGDEQYIPDIAWTSLLLMIVCGTSGGALMWGLSPWLAHRALNIPPSMQTETLRALRVLAVSLPFIVSASSLTGILAGLQRFDLINLVRVPLGFFSLLGPLMVLPFSHSIFWIVNVLVAGRVAGWMALLLACFRVFPALRGEVRMRRAMVRPLLNFGGWVTISSVSSPVIEYFGRFMLSALVSVAAVAYYAVPFQVVTKLLIVPTSMSGALFPAFSSALAQTPARIPMLLERATRYLFIFIFPAVLVICTLAPEWVFLWLGADFARNSVWAVRWLALGVFANSFAYLAFALIQAANRPDLTGKLHIIEAPFQIFLLWLLIPRYGTAGAAIAWAASIWLDAIFLSLMAVWVVPAVRQVVVRMSLAIAGALCVLAFGLIPMALPVKLRFLGLALTSFAVLTWFKLLVPIERNAISDLLWGAGAAFGSPRTWRT
ncbi:MAG: flippase [Candidatus Binataceae bacterium]